MKHVPRHTLGFRKIGGKWKLIIVYWLAESPKHYAAIGRAMPGISQKVLTQQLRELESDEIVRRRATGEEHCSRSHDTVIRVYDDAGTLIETHEHAGNFEKW